MRAIADLPELDFQSEAYRTAPFETLAGWAQRWSLARSVRGVEILDYDLCRKAIVDRKLGTGHPRLMAEIGLPDSAALTFKQESVNYFNRGDRRRDLRKPLTRLFAEAMIEKFRKDVRRVVADVVAQIPKGQPVDLIAALCDPIPSMMYCHWVGAPMTDAPFVGEASHTVQQVHARDPTRTAAIVGAFDTLIAWVEERIAARRANMDDGLLADLIRAVDAGQLSARDMRNWVIVLAAANTDNSSHSIAITLIELASRPEIWARLGRDPSAVKGAVNEVMRYHPRSISTSREVMEDMVLDDVALPQGTPIFANFGAGHWNPAIYTDPGMLDIDRQGAPHLNFGGGVFSCIGRHFVTMEIEETIAYLAREVPDLSIVNRRFEHSPIFTSVAELTGTLPASA